MRIKKQNRGSTNAKQIQKNKYALEELEKETAAVCKDLAVFCDYIVANKVKTSKKTGNIGKKDCFAINALMHVSEKYEKPSYFQGRYPVINLCFYFSVKYKILEVSPDGTALQRGGETSSTFGKRPHGSSMSCYCQWFCLTEGLPGRKVRGIASEWRICGNCMWTVLWNGLPGKKLLQAVSAGCQGAADEDTTGQDSDDTDHMVKYYYEAFMEKLAPENQSGCLLKMFEKPGIQNHGKTIDLEVSVRYSRKRLGRD